MMNDFLIKEYIERLNKEDIKTFATNNGITLNDEEVDVLYVYAKDHWRTFYYGNPKELLEKLKNKLSNETYTKLELLYQILKNKLS